MGNEIRNQNVGVTANNFLATYQNKMQKETSSKNFRDAVTEKSYWFDKDDIIVSPKGELPEKLLEIPLTTGRTVKVSYDSFNKVEELVDVLTPSEYYQVQRAVNLERKKENKEMSDKEFKQMLDRFDQYMDMVKMEMRLEVKRRDKANQELKIVREEQREKQFIQKGQDEKAEAEKNLETKWENDILEKSARKVDKRVEELWKKAQSGYGFLADENGNIEYNGVVFSYNVKEDVILLGDTSKEGEVLNINLSGGTVLRVNRGNIDGLVQAIGMFSPEDVRRIMEAIATDAKAKSKPIEVAKKVTDTYEEMLDKISGVKAKS